MNIYSNWKTISRKAWSFRLTLMAGLLSGCEVALPLFIDSMPRNVFAGLSAVMAMAALFARVIVQKDFPE